MSGSRRQPERESADFGIVIWQPPKRVDADDVFCFNASDSTRIRIGGCFGTDIDIASDISGQLRLKLSGEEKKHLAEHGTENSEAYQLYVKGRFYLEQRTREGSYKAVDQFNQAIAKDSAYAQAYTGLGDAYVILLDKNAIPADQASSKVRSAAQRAMELDPSLAEPHAELAVLKEMVDWDWTGAEAEYRKAIELNPNDATAHQWYALLLENLGRINEGFDQIRKTQALDPASPQINQNAAGFLMDMHRYPEAMSELNRLVQVNPEFPLGAKFLSAAVNREKIGSTFRWNVVSFAHPKSIATIPLPSLSCISSVLHRELIA